MNRQRLPNRRSGIRVAIGTGPNRLTLSTGEYHEAKRQATAWGGFLMEGKS